jgi:3-hydroxypropanoate dehydrogenase
MKTIMIDPSALNALFLEAHTHSFFQNKPVTDAQLRALYDLTRMPPTSVNCSPMRVVFVRSAQGKEKLRLALSEGNLKKTMDAPVCAIIAYDTQFHDLIPKLYPPMTAAREWFVGEKSNAAREMAAFRNGTLQGGYFILAARALGLDCGPMSGFDNAKVDAAFFADGQFKSNFLCNLGYGDASKVHPRGPRLSFEEACELA